MDDTTACPICTLQLQVQGDNLRAFGSPSASAVTFGKEVIALECGHRMHRQCLVNWLNTSLTPTCPMCRQLTNWKPELQEEKRLSRLVETSWKVLSNNEQNVVLLTWIIAGIVILTDPIGYFVISSILMVLTPPIFYGEIAILFAFMKKYLVGKQPAGVRMTIAIGVATIITLLTMANHEVVDMVS
jgi:Ring finger domain